MRKSDIKKALLLCATHNDLGLVRALRKMGYYIIATGTKIDPLGGKWVDEWIVADYSDKEEILNLAKQRKITAICQCCNDFGVYTAAYVAEKLCLPGYDSYETTLTLHNKDRFKQFALANGILVPEYYLFQDREAAVDGVENMSLPVIIKPVDASAGNGVKKIEDATDIQQAVEFAFQNSREKRIVAEQFIEGNQYGFCTFLQDRKVVAIASNNEYSIVNPYRVEIDTYPADTFDECKDFLVREIEHMADVLQLKDGIFHLQYIYADGKPWIIEVMRRILGNMYSIPANQLTGFDWDYWEVRAKCGLSCQNFPRNMEQEGYYAYKTLMAPKNGVIESIEIPESYGKYIYDEYWLLYEGDYVKNYMKQPVGFLFMIFSSREEMERILVDEYLGDLVKVR